MEGRPGRQPGQSREGHHEPGKEVDPTRDAGIQQPPCRDPGAGAPNSVASDDARAGSAPGSCRVSLHRADEEPDGERVPLGLAPRRVGRASEPRAAVRCLASNLACRSARSARSCPGCGGSASPRRSSPRPGCTRRRSTIPDARVSPFSTDAPLTVFEALPRTATSSCASGPPGAPSDSGQRQR